MGEIQTANPLCECAARYGRQWHRRDCPALTPEEKLRNAISETCKKLSLLATDAELVNNYIARHLKEIIKTLRGAL